MKKELVKFLVLLTVALGAGPVGAAIWQWSSTPSSNTNADPTINWAIGMAPSAVDPSARAMMARIAEWRDDTSGALATGGTSTAYTLTTNEATGGNGICTGTAPTNGTQIAITPNVTNGTSPAITVDACSSAPIQQSAGVAVASGTMVSGTPYRLTYSVANTAWMLQGFFALGNQPYAVPLGALLPYTASTAPNSNYILPAGQCISTTTYATYWALLGSPVPGGCGAGTFKVIDMRGNVPAGLDNLNGSAASLLTSAATGCGTAMTSVGATCANGAQSFTQLVGQMPAHNHTITDPGHTHSHNAAINGAGSGTPGPFTAPLNAPGAATINSNTTGITINTTAAATAMPHVQPTVAVGYLLRVL